MGSDRSMVVVVNNINKLIVFKVLLVIGRPFNLPRAGMFKFCIDILLLMGAYI